MTRKRALDAIFPWGSDTESEDDPVGQQQAPVRMIRSEPRHDKVPHGIIFNLIPEGSQAGKVLAHCQEAIHKLRMGTGGESLAIYKVGITHDYEDRFELYRKNGWTKMLIMFQSSDLDFVEMLEAALISHHVHLRQCRNILRGGEGMRDSMFNPKFDAPFYCYCTAARADGPRWVL